MARELASGDCRGECNWTGTNDQIDDLQVFACGACGSEWIPTESWTPRNADGEIDPGVAAARAAHPVAPSSPW
ncbi:hypothetical protein ACQB6R_02500 [Propionibacteriaceae bacterium G1746]|uniref:hypothetical protein n=1 Tax=Aestuariimicrobium sp. G57 TaxID=3418485 RepID=UPI003C136B5C